MTMIALSVVVWAAFELFLFDGSVLMAGPSGFACWLAIVLVVRQQHGPPGESLSVDSQSRSPVVTRLQNATRAPLDWLTPTRNRLRTTLLL